MDKLSVCVLDENNKMKYSHVHDFNLMFEEIINTINGSSVLVFVDNYYDPVDFVKTKKIRFFTGEELNFGKTSYVIWDCEFRRTFAPSNYLNYNPDQILLNVPRTIKYIRFPNKYNNELVYLPSNITHIIFGDEFNKSVDYLPQQIEYLYFGQRFNKMLENIPSTLKILLFHELGVFNQKLDNLPCCIEKMFLPITYSQSLDNLPNFLTSLELYYKYPHCLNNLPNKIEKLIFYNNDTYHKSFFTKCTPNDYHSVPEIPKYYIANSKGEYPLMYGVDRVFSRLPKSLKFLDLTFSYKLNIASEFVEFENDNKLMNKFSGLRNEIINKNLPLGEFPEDLKVLKFPANYNMIQVEKIPQKIVKLWLSNPFNKSIDKMLNCNYGTSKPRPPTLITHLIFGIEFNQFVNALPETITHLYFGNKFNKPVSNLPNSILFIRFGLCFNNTIDQLPQNIKSIEFGANFVQNINNLPNSVEEVKFCERRMQEYSEVWKKNIEVNYYYNTPIKKIPANLKKIHLNCIPNYNNNKNKDELFDKTYPNFAKYKHLANFF